MALIVHKYGGTSMGSTERIRNVAKRVAKWARAGHQMVVVPSAMSGETNRLLGLAKELAPGKTDAAYDRELDMLASTGEQASSALLAIALQCEGMQSVSYAGWQVPIKTNSAFTKARIESIDDERVRKDLAAGRVVIVTGFQGVDPDGNITTLGRGGSDTSAVAVAAAMKADECLIYTDVDGVYTTDPRVVPEARRLTSVSFEEMLEMASLGSKVLQIRSVEFAGKYSSASVYGPWSGSPEWGPVQPQHLYAVSKLVIDNWVASRYFSVPVQGMRFFNVYGRNEAHKAQPSPIRTYMKQAIAGQPLTVWNHNGRLGTRDFVSVDDCIQAMMQLKDAGVSGVYNIGTGVQLTFEDIAHSVQRRCDNVQVVLEPMPEHMVEKYQWESRADLNKLQSTIPWNPQSVDQWLDKNFNNLYNKIINENT